MCEHIVPAVCSGGAAAVFDNQGLSRRRRSCGSCAGTHAHNENANLSNGRIFKRWIFEFRAAHSVISTLIVRYAMSFARGLLRRPGQHCNGN